MSQGALNYSSTALSQLLDATNKKQSTGAILLYVSKAFDKVWHEDLLYKLIKLPLPPSSIFPAVISYLSHPQDDLQWNMFYICPIAEISH